MAQNIIDHMQVDQIYNGWILTKKEQHPSVLGGKPYIFAWFEKDGKTILVNERVGTKVSVVLARLAELAGENVPVQGGKRKTRRHRKTHRRRKTHHKK